MTRQHINLTTKLAAALLRIKSDSGYLISEPLRSSGTAAEIVAAVQWDHGALHALDGPDTPQNLWPMLTADHREKSRSDTSKVAKVKRLSASQEEFRAKVTAKLQGDVDAIQPRRKKAKIANRGFNKTKTRTFKGEVINREPRS